MFDPLIASHLASPRRRFVASTALALAAHVALVGAAVSGTARSRSPASAPPIPILSWPRDPRPTAVTTAPSRLPGLPRPPDIAIPDEVGMPRIDAPGVFDGSQWVREAGHGVNAARQDGDPDEPWSMASIEEAPVLLAGPALAYPEGLRRAGISGRVVVAAVLDTLGRAEPGSVTIVRSPNRAFDAAARDYVIGAPFRPARVHGRAVRVLVHLPIDFTIPR
jgi:TonB family protein